MPRVLPLLLLLLLPVSALADTPEMEACPVAQEMAVKGIDLFDIKPAEGVEALEKAYAKCPEDLGVGYNLGLSLYLSGDKKKARQVWEEVHRRHPDHLKTHANLSWVNFELGDDESAHILAFKGLSLYPENLALAHSKLYSLFRLGRYLEAFDWLTRANIKGVQAAKWREQAVGYVVETLWEQFRKGEKDEAVSRAVMLLRDYQDEPLVTAKDKLVQAMVDREAEIPYPVPLPHETWAKTGDVGEGKEMLDEFIATLPHLNDWQKRTDAYALFVGIYRYKKTNARYFADRDARNLHRLLSNRGLFPDDLDHVRMRLNEEATQDMLQRDLEWLIQQARINPNALVLFHFSGHGLVWSAERGSPPQALLMPVELVPEQISAGQAISLEWFRAELEKLPNKEIVIILDTCFNREAGCSPEGYTPPTADLPADYFNWKKSLFLATRKGGLHPYAQGRQNALSYFLAKGMLGEADGLAGREADGWVDFQEAATFAKKEIDALKTGQDVHASAILPLRITRTGGER